MTWIHFLEPQLSPRPHLNSSSNQPVNFQEFWLTECKILPPRTSRPVNHDLVQKINFLGKPIKLIGKFLFCVQELSNLSYIPLASCEASHFFFSQQITPYHPYHFLYPCSLHAPSIILTASFAIFSLSKNHSPPYLNSQTRTYVEVCMKWKKICTLTPLIPFICPRTQSHHCYEKLLYVILVCYTQQLLYSYLNLV